MGDARSRLQTAWDGDPGLPPHQFTEEEATRLVEAFSSSFADDEVIALFRERLMAGRFGDRELLMPAERDYSGIWAAFVAMLPGWEARFGRENPVVSELRAAVHSLADARPNAVRVFALNTTMLGRESEYGVERG